MSGRMPRGHDFEKTKSVFLAFGNKLIRSRTKKEIRKNDIL